LTNEFMARADHSLQAAQLLLEKGFNEDACSRAYYAMFDAARASLSACGAPVQSENIKTHSGLIAAFNLHVIKPGLMPQIAGKRLGQAQHSRLLADYDSGFIEPNDAAETVAWAIEFVGLAHAAFDSRPEE
jgi:uncharacterized protein (UPF0332 family)